MARVRNFTGGECGQSDGATDALDRKDRGSQSDRTLVV